MAEPMFQNIYLFGGLTDEVVTLANAVGLAISIVIKLVQTFVFGAAEEPFKVPRELVVMLEQRRVKTLPCQFLTDMTSFNQDAE